MASVRLSQGGFTLRFGESDTPVPEGVIPLGSPPRIVVAIAPADPRLRVEARFRVDEGPERFVALRPERRTRDEQFFEGGLPGLRGGETVEYWICARLESQGTETRLDSSAIPGGTRRFEVMGAAPRSLDVPGAPRVIDRLASAEVGATMQGAEYETRPTSFRVQGNVRAADGMPTANLVVRLVSREIRGDVPLGETRTDLQGQYQIVYAEAQRRPPNGEKSAAELVVRIFGAAGSIYDGKLLCESAGIRQPRPLEIVDLVIPSMDRGTFQVVGRVASRVSAGVGGLRVVIVAKGVGGDALLTDAVTNVDGTYQAAFTAADLRRRERNETQPDLQARVFAGDKPLAASDVRYNASNRETLNVLLDETAIPDLQSEYETLTGALALHYKGRLGGLQESGDRQDITYLANKTGWDARAVAFAALADEFSRGSAQDGQGAIAPDYYYALLRAWLPADEDALCRTAARTLTAVWWQAAAQGVIRSELVNEERLAPLLQRFQKLRVEKLLETSLIGVSSLGDMLSISQSPLQTPKQRLQFVELCVTYQGDIAGFWSMVGEVFGANAAQQLQVDGKLAFLTINNASLMKRLHSDANGGRITDPLQLAEDGYHSTEMWRSKLDDGSIPITIPKEVQGSTEEARKINYAEYLAASVRLSTSSGTVVHLVRSGALILEAPVSQADGGPVPTTAEIIDQVASFLGTHKGKFEIGKQPLQQYLVRNPGVQCASEVLRQIKRIERVYQITPSFSAMTALLNSGIGSAYDIVRYERESFVATFQEVLRDGDLARRIYDRAEQVHNAVINIAISYQTARIGIPLGGELPPPQALAPGRARPVSGGALPESARDAAGQFLQPVPMGPLATNASDVIAYPTLESLFGSMDYCTCDHCRSILSPAAYLVDLLHFIDPPVGDKPLDILRERRPDIESLLLTCENTNTALPHIDLVNEILEYFVVHSNLVNPLVNYEGHDTGSAASEDLLASPQFVTDEAYKTLGEKSFPAPLPFHQPLENLRRYFNRFEVPMPLAMERLRKNDDLYPGLSTYSWRDTLMEELRLSRAEYALLTQSTSANGSSDFETVRTLYGYDQSTTEAEVFAELSNAKKLTRRITITYDDLVAILRTRFINPNSDLIPKAEQLGVTFFTLKGLQASAATGTDWLKLLPLPLPDAAEYGGNIETWVKATGNCDRIMALITLTIPIGNWGTKNTFVIGDCVRPTDPPDDSMLYYVCTTPGERGQSEPTLWPETPGESCPDGTVVWTCRDMLSAASFDDVALRHADPDQITQNIAPVVFIRLMRFVRLWKKLGWTIEQTDAAICALFHVREDLKPLVVSDIDSLDNLNAGFLTLLPRLGIAMRVMQALKLTVKRDLLSLLACWSDIGTYGQGALYRQMFLNPALLEQDPVFKDNEYGEFLQRADVPYTHSQATLEQAIIAAAQGRIGYDDTTKRLSYAGALDVATRDALKAVPGVSLAFQQAVDALYRAQRLPTHAEALRSAFNLTGDEYDQIIVALGYDASTDLTRPNISAILRRGWLARKLKLSVRELLLLTRLTGLDPFAAPDPTNPAILRLIELVQSMKDRSLKTAAALYLIWNQDLSGKSAPNPEQLADFARTLRGDFAAIDAQLAVTEDPGGDVARAQVALVYGQETADTLFSILDDNLVLDVAYTQAAATLEAAINSTDPNIAYDSFQHRLSHVGALTGEMASRLKAIVGVPHEFPSAVAALFVRSEMAKGSFLTRYPELESLCDAYTASAEPKEKKRAAFLAAFRPELSQRRKRQQALQRLSAAAAVDLAFTQTLLDPPAAPYPLHAGGQLGKPGLDDVMALETPGLAAQYYDSDTVGNNPHPVVVIASNLDYASGGSNALRANITTPGNPISGVWQGKVEAPESGYFNFIIEADPGATVTLEFDGQNCLLTPNDNIWRNTDSLELRAGTLYDIKLEVAKVQYRLRVTWETQKRPREVIPTRYLYPPAIFEPFSAAYTRFLKSAALATTLKLTAREIAYIATDADYQIAGDGWLNVLSVSGGTPNPDRLLKPLEALLDFARIKAALAPNDERLLSVIQDPAATLPNGDRLLLAVTRWDATSLSALLDHFTAQVGSLGQPLVNGQTYDNITLAAGLAQPLAPGVSLMLGDGAAAAGPAQLLKVKEPGAASGDTVVPIASLKASTDYAIDVPVIQPADLTHLATFVRVYDVFALVQKTGISAKALIQATTNEPAGDTVRDLQAALRARYDASSWRDVVRPLNDEMRGLQRDALVAYILHQLRSNPDTAHIDTADKLFEYFLMDVQMEPCMQTSRIRHALSSVQLFIERCLMNLEPRVSLSSDLAKRWEWMKRYRVWEANRKVFLFPENWLEPELRDQISPFFKELESELLQSDITEDAVATSLLNYLAKLEEVAKLEPCGIYHTDKKVDHVIARTAGAQRKYYYRRHEGCSWTPWEQIKLDIEDNPVIPVVWNDRVFLFWLRLLKRPSVAPPFKPSVPVKPGDPGPALVSLTTSELQADPPSVIVEAILCWSEYYNGKWQPTKTSDVDRPLSVDEFSPSEFDRAELQLRSSNADKAVLIHVSYAGKTPKSFKLHNTHSLPMTEDGNWTDRFLLRLFQDVKNSKGQPLVVTYYHQERLGASFTRTVLGQAMPYSIAEHTIVPPAHPIGDAWKAPFFYQDARHVFFVETGDPQPSGSAYLPLLDLELIQVEVPSVILPGIWQVLPELSDTDWSIVAGSDLINSGPIQEFIEKDGYIKRGIGAIRPVMYGEKLIGPNGAQLRDLAQD